MKSWPWFFEAFLDGRKLHDLRANDRQFKVGDTVELQEFDPRTGQYSGRTFRAEISYLTSNDFPCALSSAVLPKDYVILSLRQFLA